MFGFGMPADAALASAAYGACFGLLPIGWIVLAAVFLFHLTVRPGQFEIVKHSVAALSPDRRMQALLIAFCFGTFVEGAAGFGTPVAISAALLIGLGFSPLYAAGLALMANTSPVAFGALGTPIITLAKISGHRRDGAEPDGRPAVAVVLADRAGLAGGHDVGLARRASAAGRRSWSAAAALPAIQFLMSNFHGPTLVDVVGGLGSLVCLTVFLRFWQPREIWRFPDEPPSRPRCRRPRTDARRDRLRLGAVGAAVGAGVSVGHARVSATVFNGGDAKQPERAGRHQQTVAWRDAALAQPGLSHRAGGAAGRRQPIAAASPKRRSSSSTGCRRPAPASFWRRC